MLKVQYLRETLFTTCEFFYRTCHVEVQVLDQDSKIQFLEDLGSYMVLYQIPY